ncbi:SDR family NAD(P)-dependent oxidoreductase [Reinekea marinisedimentorum]|uniref:NAD(P)-dependent dehydrogenase (Short-subunit alcohol dehydrogenase family) n=1 Tax=Reinekea marinisedimentorum TaxID=230495 RepID=A0A4R3ICG3_9GAMM|nr:SDR family NAD(P)-dependent oxidoreductase [Reinekea marinisedimentorum]TCS43315.1 NAD(P)-dependent dehydrogenase (short-subunit alcohol dehydrogenase family) [Reinekea marinisedimentorum]
MKKALVTGGNRGIGFAITQGLMAEGFEVYLGARDWQLGEQAAIEAGAQFVQLDVSNPESIRAAVNEIQAVDVLVNNAGVLGSGGVLDSEQEFAISMATMVHGPFLLMHLLAPAMIENNYGRIVNISSDWGLFSEGMKGPGGYGVAKAALNALTFSAASSLPNNVKVNAMCPGWVNTRMGGFGSERPPEKGAETAIWLATLPETGPTGKFFRDKNEMAW